MDIQTGKEELHGIHPQRTENRVDLAKKEIELGGYESRGSRAINAQ